ncbi:hypothetical protein C4M96_03235 [Mycoplasmopsis pullorum]|uniref:hypothetical protein n=2 Tax=Mycoplasmopsis pullorum TaxID=48003 RepID=UPI00111A93A0|nr:hypothetical protein [Mycoplasmopsis pullorum]TNK91839.1 hypothetical protein C4M96_03235 [Mycoplasmopsis pullorum]
MITEKTKEILDIFFKKNKNLSHCYLIDAPQNYDCSKELTYIVNLINYSQIKDIFDNETAQHNIFVLTSDSEKKSISKEELQITFDKVEYSSVELDKLKIVVIKNIENTSTNAINSILKQIEEPPKNTIILMSSSNLNKVIPTIRSRSQIIKIFKENPDSIYQNLVNSSLDLTISFLLSWTCESTKSALKYTDVKNIKFINELIESFLNSVKNKFYLYAFLDQNLTENHTKNIFVLRLLINLIHLASNPSIIRKDEVNYDKFLRFNSFARRKNIELHHFFEVINFYFKAINSNCNFHLQKENLLINLMRIYG